MPTKNWTTGYFEDGKDLTAEVINKTIALNPEGCFACPIRCKRVSRIDDKSIHVEPKYGGPEYEGVTSMGSLCGIGDIKYVAKANELCNKYTLDTISTGSTIAFAMQCYENGIITKDDTDGIELRFGNKEALLAIIEKIAKREGFGSILAEGSLRASKMIGNGAERFVHTVKGQELPMHDPRLKTGVALQYALSDYGADHMKAPHDGFFSNKDSYGMATMSGLGILDPVSITDMGIKKVRLFKTLDIYWSLFDILGVCDFGYVPRSVGSIDELLDIIRSTTGWNTTWYELMRASERSINMARMFNIREGFGSKDDILPDIFFEDFDDCPQKGKRAINKEDFYEAVKLRYALMGWDDAGVPTKGKLFDLGLDWLVYPAKSVTARSDR